MTGRFRVERVEDVVFAEQTGFFSTPLGLAFIGELRVAIAEAAAASGRAHIVADLRAFQGCTAAHQVNFEQLMNDLAAQIGELVVVAPGASARLTVQRSQAFVPGVMARVVHDVDEALRLLGRPELVKPLLARFAATPEPAGDEPPVTPEVPVRSGPQT